MLAPGAIRFVKEAVAQSTYLYIKVTYPKTEAVGARSDRPPVVEERGRSKLEYGGEGGIRTPGPGKPVN